MTQARWLAAGAVAGLVAVTAACQKTATRQAAGAKGQAAAQGSAASGPARPRRKAGLWEQKVAFGKVDQVTRICLDAATEQHADWTGRAGPAPCRQQAVTPRPGGGWAFSSVCDLGEAGTVTSRGVATGDFSTHYRLDMESTTTGAAAPQMNGVRRFSLEADWKGPCPADMRPGDISLPNGLKINPTGLGHRTP